MSADKKKTAKKKPAKKKAKKVASAGFSRGPAPVRPKRKPSAKKVV